MTRLQTPTHHNIAAFIAAEDFVRNITGYTFSNRHLLLIALYGNATSAHPRQRLAFLGDGILKYLICEAWYETGGSTSTGSVFSSWAVSNEHLAVVATTVGLDKHINPFYEDENVPLGIGSLKTKHLGTTMEALFGAIHEDSGKDIPSVRLAMVRMGLLAPREEVLRRMNSVKAFNKEQKKETWRDRRESRNIERSVNRPEERGLSFKRLGAFGASSTDSEDFEDPATGQEDPDDSAMDQALMDAQFNGYDKVGESSLVGSDGDPMEPVLFERSTDDPEWRQHGWVPQHCQITLEVAQSGRTIRRRP